jgi:hypothetical protein
MYRVPQAGLTKPAVAGRLERGVRHHLALQQWRVRLCRPQGLRHCELADKGAHVKSTVHRLLPTEPRVHCLNGENEKSSTDKPKYSVLERHWAEEVVLPCLWVSYPFSLS